MEERNEAKEATYLLSQSYTQMKPSHIRIRMLGHQAPSYPPSCCVRGLQPSQEEDSLELTISRSSIGKSIV